jgi:hypothetical protein
MIISSEACQLFAKLLALHFTADFLLQPREMGKKKSSHLSWLAGHLAIQWTIFALFTNWQFATANALIHGVIDWNIWRGYKWFVGQRLYDGFGNKWKSLMQGKPHHSLMSDGGEWQFWEDHWFYATIGFDQLLHAITLAYLAEKFL